MSPHASEWVLVLACLAIACGGRSTLDDTLLLGTAAGANGAGGTPAVDGGARASGGSLAGSGGTASIGVTVTGNGGATATGGTWSAKGGAATTGGVLIGTGGARATGGTISVTQGGTATSTGASSGAGGVGTSHTDTGNQAGVRASGGKGVSSGGVSATGGVSDTAASSGGTGPTDTSGNCEPYRVMCGTGPSAQCVDLSTDTQNCGICGKACSRGARCIYGECELPRCAPTFSMGGIPTVETERSAYALATGDFNRDGHTDLATANLLANTVSVLLGDGKGGFRRGTDYATGSEPRAVAVGDFDSDGILDLATANSGADSVSVLVGKGDGSLESAKHYPVGQYPLSIIIADFDGNYIDDIVTPNANSDNVSVLLGLGQGSFATKVDYPAGVNPSQIVAADVNNDGITDLITDGGPSSISVLLGAGAGKFTATLAAPEDAGDAAKGRLALGDVDVDGKPDVIVARATGRWSSGTFGVLFGAGDGSFSPMREYEPGASGLATLADLDKDGKLELIAYVRNQSLSIFSVDASGSLVDEVQYPTPASPQAVAIGDFNGDDWPDIATLDLWGIYILMATGQGRFDSPHTQPTGTEVKRVLLRDLNGDGRLDLAVTAYTDTIGIQLGRDDGTFSAVNVYPAGHTQDFIEAADLDDDGDLDLVAASSAEPGVSVLWNAGDASYPSRTEYTTSSGVDSLALGDTDNDGQLDILVASNGTSSEELSSLSVLFNSGNRVFVPGLTMSTAAPWLKLTVGDLNHDGNLDVIQTNGEEPGVTVRLGSGDGTFGLTLQSATSDRAISGEDAALGDLDGDGNLDLVSSNYSRLQVVMGAGDGTFIALEPQLVAEGYDLGEFALGDVNGDGILDLVSGGVVSWVGYEIVIMLGAGDGTFSCATAGLAGGSDRGWFALGDVDGNDRLDIVVPNGQSRSISVLLNQPHTHLP